jgi:hypothetical protein
MAYNPQPVLGVASWNGNPPIATLRQLNSTIAIISTVSLSNFSYISTVSNSLSTTAAFNFSTLEGQIQGLILSTGGSTASWASFPALTNVNLNNKNITGGATVTATQFNGNITGTFFSTTNLQTSSINGIAIDFFNSTITLQGVTITNNSIITQNITQQKTIFEQVVGGINAVASAVSEINSAVGGFLSNTFGVVQQVYYGARAVGAIVDLTTSVVELATAGQALADSRTINTISGGNVGAVYETFNHTSQLQFSTLMSTTLTFYRTTTAANPNLFFGREVIISSYISAGTKCLRSIGDPMHMPIASTQLLSTTNFIQSFGQWSPILANDNNLNANTASISSLTVSSIYGNWFSTGTAFISSINNQPISAFINTDDPTFNSVSTSFISTGRLLVSSINDSIKITSSNITGVGNLGVNTLNSAITVSTSNITGVGNLGIETLNSVIIVSTSNISGVNNLDLNIINSAISLSSSNITGVGNLGVTTLNSAITVTSSNICNVGQFQANNGIFNNAIIVTNNAQVGSLTSLGAISGTSGSFSGNVGLNTLNATGAVNGATAVITGSISGGSLFTLNNTVTGSLAATSAVIGALTVSGAAGVGSLSITGTTTAATINATTISNSGLLTSESISTNNLSTGAVFISSINGVDINSFGGATTLAFLSTTSISSATASISSIFTNFLSSPVTFISSINGINVNSFGGSSTSISAATASISSIFTNNLSTAVGNISSLSIYGNLVFLTAAKGYDISKTLTSTVTNYDNVSSLTQDIFGYKMNLTTTGEPQSFDMGSFFAVTDENATLWSKKQLTYSGELADGQAPTINIVPGDFITSDRFDVKNIATNGAILNIWNPFVSGGLLLQMVPGTYYRFTYSGSAWTFAANPTNIGATYFNTFAIYQGWEQTTISTGNIINLEAGAVNIPGFTAMDTTNINYLTAGGATFSTIVSPYVSSSALFLSSINGSNINLILNPTTLPFLSTTSISTAQINASSIQMTGGLVFSTPSTIADISKITSLFSLTGSNLAGYKNKILDYEFDTSVVSQPTVTYPFPTSEVEFFWAQVGTWGEAINTFLAGGVGFLTILLGVDSGSGTIPVSGFCDIYNQFQTSGITVRYNPPGTSISVPFGSTYRFSWTLSGVSWTVNTSPSPISVLTQTNFNISQDFTGAYISTSDILSMDATSIFLNAPYTQANKFNAGIGLFSTIQTSFISSLLFQGGAFTGSNADFQALSANTISTATLAGSNIFTTNLTGSTINTFIANTTTLNGATILCSSLTTSNTLNADAVLVRKFQGNTPLSLNALTNQYVTLSGGLSGTNGRAQTNQINFLALPGMVDSGIPPGYPVNTTLTFTPAGLSLLNGNPAFPALWYSSITTVDNSASAKIVNFQIPTGGNGEVALLTTGINNVNVQSNGTNFGIITTIGYTKLSWNSNVFTTQNVGTSSPYLSTLVTQDTRIQTGANNAMNLINKQTLFNGDAPIIFFQNFTGFFTGSPVGRATGSGVLSFNGSNFATNQWSCYLSFYNINLAQNNLAINNFNVTAQAIGSNWGAYCYTGIATVAGGATTGVNWNVQCMMVPKEFSLIQNFNKFGEEPPEQDLPPSTFTSTISFFNRLEMPEILVSSITASTIALEVSQNMSLLAGIPIPGYFGTGNITIAGTASVEIIGDQAVIGGLTDVNIDAVNRDVLITAASTISLIGYNTLLSNAGDIDLYGGSNKRVRLYANNINIEDGTGNIINFGSNLYDSFTNIGRQRVKYGTDGISNIMDVTNLDGHINLNADSNNVILTGQNFTLTDPVSGGFGSFTVDSNGSLYWNGNFIV